MLDAADLAVSRWVAHHTDAEGLYLKRQELWILDPPAHSADEDVELGGRSSSDYFGDDLNH